MAKYNKNKIRIECKTFREDKNLFGVQLSGNLINVRIFQNFAHLSSFNVGAHPITNTDAVAEIRIRTSEYWQSVLKTQYSIKTQNKHNTVQVSNKQTQ